MAPERVVVTTGSSAGFVLAFLALFDAGAKVALPSPGYPCYRHILTALGQTPVLLDTDASVALDADRAPRSTRRVRRDGIARAGRRQPRQSDRHHAGAGAPGRDRRRLPAQRHLAGVGRDLPRPDLRHARGDGARPQRRGGRRQQLLEVFLDDRLAHRLAGRAAGAGAARSSGLAQNLYISPPAVAQVAALGAFDGIEELEANKRVYAENRALLLDELPKAGLERIVPADGAFSAPPISIFLARPGVAPSSPTALAIPTSITRQSNTLRLTSLSAACACWRGYCAL